jgi:hypothetical protein
VPVARARPRPGSRRGGDRGRPAHARRRARPDPARRIGHRDGRAPSRPGRRGRRSRRGLRVPAGAATAGRGACPAAHHRIAAVGESRAPSSGRERALRPTSLGSGRRRRRGDRFRERPARSRTASDARPSETAPHPHAGRGTRASASGRRCVLRRCEHHLTIPLGRSARRAPNADACGARRRATRTHAARVERSSPSAPSTVGPPFAARPSDAPRPSDGPRAGPWLAAARPGERPRSPAAQACRARDIATGRATTGFPSIARRTTETTRVGGPGEAEVPLDGLGVRNGHDHDRLGDAVSVPLQLRRLRRGTVPDEVGDDVRSRVQEPDQIADE